MTRFGAIEYVSGNAMFVSVDGVVEIMQEHGEGHDVTVRLESATPDEVIDELNKLKTLAFGNQPIPKIEISVKDDGKGQPYFNGKEVNLDTLVVESWALINFVKRVVEI